MAAKIKEKNRGAPACDPSPGPATPLTPAACGLQSPPPSWLARFWTQPWSWVALALILILAVFSRFHELGLRVMSHDESLHTLYSWYLANTGDYHHDPMMHGPLLFHQNALIYCLLGDGETTARAIPALYGVAVVLWLFAFRRYLGQWGAFMAAVLALISPSLLFYSRYIRNDIYICLFTLVWVYSVFRYLEDRKPQWLYAMTLAMALSFACKEVAYMHGAVIGAFLAGLSLWHWLKDRTHPLQSPAWDLTLLMISLALPLACALAIKAVGWDPMDNTTTLGQKHIYQMGGAFAALGAVTGLAWFALRRPFTAAPGSILDFRFWILNCKPDRASTPEPVTERPLWRWRLAGCLHGVALFIVFWGVMSLLYTTMYTRIPDGIASGLSRSLGYWLAQHSVQRGGQPWFYYLMLTALYEFLPLVLCVGALVILARQYKSAFAFGKGRGPAVSGPTSQLSGSGSTQPFLVEPFERGSLFILFCVWWWVGNGLAYSIAGEKMPWLLTHIVLPMCLLGGAFAGRIMDRLARQSGIPPKSVWLLAVIPVASGIALNGPGLESAAASTSPALQWMRVGAGLAALGWLFIRLWPLTPKPVRLPLVGIGALLLLTVWTVRASWLLTFVNYDLASEPLVFAHGAPDIKRTLQEIDDIRDQLADKTAPAAAYDDETAWPLTWYFRRRPHVFYGAEANASILRAPVIICGPKNLDKVRALTGKEYLQRTDTMLWWPIQDYQQPTAAKLNEWFLTAKGLKRIRDIVVDRSYEGVKLSEWPLRKEYHVFYRRDVAPTDRSFAQRSQLENEVAAFWASAGQTSVTTRATWAGPFAGKPLRQPRAVSVGADGRMAIADSGNNRVVVLSREGQFLFELTGKTGAAKDPGFKEPWGVALGAQGDIFVSDTWNGRIQRFNGQGQFIQTWGAFGAVSTPSENPWALYGPRGLALDRQGRLLVADTGNNRILRFTADGQFQVGVGGLGAQPGCFSEPVSVAVDPRNETILVADMWNRRIQRFSTDLQFMVEYPVPVWLGRESVYKACLTIDGQGRIMAVAPQQSHLMLFGPDGKLRTWFGEFGKAAHQLNVPCGLAMDPSSKTLYVADAENNRILGLTVPDR